MANFYSIRVHRVLEKVTPTSSIITLDLHQEYCFSCATDFVLMLRSIRLDHYTGFLRIISIRVGDSFYKWSRKRNCPTRMSNSEFSHFLNALD